MGEGSGDEGVDSNGPAVSNKLVGRWAVVIDDVESENDEDLIPPAEGTVEVVDRGENQMANEVAQSVLVEGNIESHNVVLLLIPERPIEKETHLREKLVQTVTCSPGVTTVVGNHGRIEVNFSDVVAVDEAVKNNEAQFTSMGKCPPGRQSGRENKKAEVPSVFDARQSRHEL
ncbi:hypothetical protein NE237_023209 [Protea cynaroides]|uniref:Uncharacterized protein n=1 Tax=Protea cynaroides TaxID=273540 RepID=A0A9Q0HCI4_9MAGN|nr:hypothetical protein NE237_023209 [Protea cynaroides]